MTGVEIGYEYEQYLRSDNVKMGHVCEPMFYSTKHSVTIRSSKYDTYNQIYTPGAIL